MLELTPREIRDLIFALCIAKNASVSETFDEDQIVELVEKLKAAL
jgi:hypothetical protein